MAITYSTSRQDWLTLPESERVVSFRDASRIFHDYDCPHYGDSRFDYQRDLECLAYSKHRGHDYYSGCREQGPSFSRRYAVGMVVADRERNYHDDSDFYAVYYNPETDSFDTTVYSTTRTANTGTCTVDASPELFAEYRSRLAAADAERLEAARLADLVTPDKGKLLKVVKGRKVAVGTIGECFWIGEGRFGTRLGLKDAQGTVHWTAASNVVVVGQGEYDADQADQDSPVTSDDESWESACNQCGASMNPAEAIMGPTCGKCCRTNHQKAVA